MRAAAAPNMPMQCDTGCINDLTKQGVRSSALHDAWGMAQSLVITDPAKRTARQSEYVKQLTAVGGDKGFGLVLPGLLYDAVMATAQAAKQAKSIDADAVKNALEHPQGDSAQALGWQYGFSPTNHAVPGDTTPPPLTSFPVDAPYKDGYFVVKPSQLVVP